jgi:hypothetical protein
MKLPAGYNLDHSIHFDITLWSEDSDINAAVDWLFNELLRSGSLKSGNASKRKNHIKIVLLNLFINFITDIRLFTSYDRNSNCYSKIQKRYNPNSISRLLIDIIDAMSESGYIFDFKGYHDRSKPKNSRISRMIANRKLIIELFLPFNFKSFKIDKSPKTECIIVRKKIGGEKIEIPYVDTPEIIEMRRNICAYNNLLKRTFIDMLFYPKEGIKTSSKEIIKINFNDKFVRRIFNDEKFSKGGRFFGGWWQKIPKYWRKRITLIGYVPSAEIDYSGLHIALLYALEGIDYWGSIKSDPYELPGYEKSKRMRYFLKKVMLTSINASNITAAKKSVIKEINFNKSELGWVYDEKIVLSDIIRDFAIKHSPISSFIFSGFGLKLQRIDSDIAAHVINHMTKLEYPVLCLHDSFIFHSLYDSILKKAMEEAFNDTIHKISHVSTSVPKMTTKVIWFDKFDKEIIEEGTSGTDEIKKHPYLGCNDDDPEYSKRFRIHMKKMESSPHEYYQL